MRWDIDYYWMKKALFLAELGSGWVNPNPLVGAIVVKDGQMIGEGWHHAYGGWHAERNALADCKEDTKGATMYVTLEPCCHHGKTPPCTDSIIAAGIKRVVVGILDPNPLVAGKGVEQLKAAGIEVEVGVKEYEIRHQNRVFLKYITTQRPWVLMKTAMTLDGKIATRTGDSRWVTSNTAQHRVHTMRAENMGIMVGMGTVRADNPMLNSRLDPTFHEPPLNYETGEIRQPVRIIVTSAATVDLDYKVILTAREQRTIFAHTPRMEDSCREALQERGVETILCPEKNGRLDVDYLLTVLGKMGLDSILLEGGGELNAYCLQEGLVDEVYTFVATKLIGGREAKTPVEGEGVEYMREAVKLTNIQVSELAEDILIMGLVDRKEQKE